MPAIIYDASAFVVVLIYIYLLVFLVILVACKKMKKNLIYFGYGVCCFLNMVNLLAGISSLGKIRTTTVKNLESLRRSNW